LAESKRRTQPYRQSHFDTPEYHQLFSVKLTPARQKIWDLHYPHYIKSRPIAGRGGGESAARRQARYLGT